MFPQTPQDLRETLHQQAQQTMDLSQKAQDWQMAQTDTAWKHMGQAWELSRTMTKNHIDAAMTLQKTMIDALAPATKK